MQDLQQRYVYMLSGMPTLHTDAQLLMIVKAVLISLNTILVWKHGFYSSQYLQVHNTICQWRHTALRGAAASVVSA